MTRARAAQVMKGQTAMVTDKPKGMLATPGLTTGVVCLALALAAALPGPARAQSRQGAPAAAEQLIDPRVEMRRFIRAISSYGRRFGRNFIVLVQDGLELLEQTDAVDTTRRVPAGTYMRAVDGILIAGLYFRPPDPDKKNAPNRTEEDETEEMLRLARIATGRGLKVFVVDFPVNRKNADESYRLNAAKGFASFAAIGRDTQLNSMPTYPARPFGENPNNITSVKQVKNFLYVNDSSKFERQEEFARTLSGANFDAVIVDVFHRGREPLNRQNVNTLKFKRLGARRLVLAYVNIGQAENFRYYWKDGWQEGSPGFIASPVLGNPDKFFVRYWDKAWQDLLIGNANSYIFGIFSQGFDGVILDGIEAFKFFETGAQ